MKDLYKILGVPKSASDAEVKAAYRKLAKELHPDRNQGDEKIAERFKEVSAAYSVLGDKENRARYDRGEIDGSGAERGPFAGAHAGAEGFAGFEDIIRGFTGGGRGGPGAGQFEFRTSGGGEDFFSDLFSFGGGQRAGGKRGRSPLHGKDVTYKITVPFEDAARGTTRRVKLQSGKTLDVKIPEGVADGQQIRLSGQGDKGLAGGKAGDALIRVSVAAHKFFRREGDDVLLDLPISVDEAVLGAKIAVPTISGKVKVSVPKGASSGARLRLKGKGIKRAKGNGHGDQIVILKIVLPEEPDKALEKAITEWRKEHGYTVPDKSGVR